MISRKYENNGVFADPARVTRGEKVTLVYHGLLAQSGADNIYACIGFGNNQEWQDVGFYHMDRTINNRFEAKVSTTRALNMNVAFKDSADNWDNNNGENYIFEKKV